MNDHFEMKIQKLSEELSNLETCKLDKLKILNCRERELLAKKEMFLWQKSNAQMQVLVIGILMELYGICYNLFFRLTSSPSKYLPLNHNWTRRTKPSLITYRKKYRNFKNVAT